MIDNPLVVGELMEKLEAALPIAARLTPELQASLRAQNPGLAIATDCTITQLLYLGDEGGILCKLDFGSRTENSAFVSITHLRFDVRLPLTRAIAAYQKHRLKNLRRGPR